MNYWQARSGLKRIVEFCNLYVKFANLTLDVGQQATIPELLQQMARLAPSVQRDLDRVGQGYRILQDAPALGGRKQLFEVTTLAYSPRIAGNYNIAPSDMVLQFQRAIGEYERSITPAFWNLFNPFWWIRELIAAVASIPFYLFGLAGFNQQRAESSRLGRMVKLIEELVLFGAALATIIQLLLSRGWLSFR